jgi:hypothetical protein
VVDVESVQIQGNAFLGPLSSKRSFQSVEDRAQLGRVEPARVGRTGQPLLPELVVVCAGTVGASEIVRPCRVFVYCRSVPWSSFTPALDG